MKSSKDSRRVFIKNSIGCALALSANSLIPSLSAKSYAGIFGANERIRVGIMEVNGRGLQLAKNFAKQKDCEVVCISDVDSRAAATCIDTVAKLQSRKPAAKPDFRKALEDKNLDVLVIAAPDHWHAPAAIIASSAGKHVYLEKPCSHNPHEGELLIKAAAKNKTIMQMGNQRRSYPNVILGIDELHNGVIGRPYFAKGWYVNNRASIGKGVKSAVPSWLDYELWQGPAPREEYRDNVIHYNWHWFWNWGTGEALNNGTHMLDLMRWGLKVDYPTRVTSTGGRYRYQDDWQTPDTQVIALEFDNNTSMLWEGRSCNGRYVEESSVGVSFYGETGSLVIVGGDSYKIYDLKNKLVKEVKSQLVVDPLNLSGPGEALDAIHIRNFLEAIRSGKPVNSDIVGGHKSTLLCQLGNIALRSGNNLNIDPTNGHIKNDPVAQRYWKRDYEPGWEPKV